MIATQLPSSRIHFDVCPIGGATRDEEVARLEALGATRKDLGQSDGSRVDLGPPHCHDGSGFDLVSVRRYSSA
jgi:hypothetical protein